MGVIGTSGDGVVVRFLADNFVFKIFVTFRVLLGEDVLGDVCGQLAGFGVSLDVCMFRLIALRK
jgi:hypothetical protein